MNEETKRPIDDINHPERKMRRQALSAFLHQAIEEFAQAQGGLHYVDAAVVLANLAGAIAAQGGVEADVLCGMLTDTCAETKIELAAELVKRAQEIAPAGSPARSLIVLKD